MIAEQPADRLVRQLSPTGLYLLFDPRQRADWAALLRQLAGMGVGVFQLRAKAATQDEIRGWFGAARLALGDAILLLNDRPEWAGAFGFDGVHVGPEDVSPTEARQLLGGVALVGSSGDNVSRLTGTLAEAADYFGVGAYRTTATKPDAGAEIGAAGLSAAVKLTKKPVVAIGGLRPADAAEVRQAGACGMAVYGGIWQAAEPLRAAEAYIQHWRHAA